MNASNPKPYDISIDPEYEQIGDGHYYFKGGHTHKLALDVARLTAENEKLKSALINIHNQSKAYPLSVFPEPDFQRAKEWLEAGGMTLDSISASNMRVALEGVGKIAIDALKGAT